MRSVGWEEPRKEARPSLHGGHFFSGDFGGPTVRVVGDQALKATPGLGLLLEVEVGQAGLEQKSRGLGVVRKALGPDVKNADGLGVLMLDIVGFGEPIGGIGESWAFGKVGDEILEHLPG